MRNANNSQKLREDSMSHETEEALSEVEGTCAVGANSLSTQSSNEILIPKNKEAWKGLRKG